MTTPEVLATPRVANRPVTVTTARSGSLVRELSRFHRSSPLGAAIVFVVLESSLLVLFPDVVAPYDSLAASYGQTRQAPSLQHLLGTDHLGRDVLSRMLHGTRVTMFVAVSSVLIGDAIGFTWGVASGYAGR